MCHLYPTESLPDNMFLEKLCGKVISRFFPTSFETLRPVLALFANNGGKNESGVHIWVDTCRHVMETCCRLMASFVKLPVCCFQLNKRSVFVAIYVCKLIMFCRHHLGNLLLWTEVVPKAGCGKLAWNFCLPLSSAWWLGLIFSFLW